MKRVSFWTSTDGLLGPIVASCEILKRFAPQGKKREMSFDHCCFRKSYISWIFFFFVPQIFDLIIFFYPKVRYASAHYSVLRDDCLCKCTIVDGERVQERCCRRRKIYAIQVFYPTLWTDNIKRLKRMVAGILYVYIYIYIWSGRVAATTAVERLPTVKRYYWVQYLCFFFPISFLFRPTARLIFSGRRAPRLIEKIARRSRACAHASSSRRIPRRPDERLRRRRESERPVKPVRRRERDGKTE